MNPSALLDGIVDGTVPPPPMVKTLRLPRIRGWEGGKVWLDWNVDPDMFHSAGAVSGSYLAALADQILAVVTLTALREEETFRTSDLRISFFRPVTTGALQGEASVFHRGRRVAYVEAIFKDDRERVVLKATATQLIASGGEE